MLGIGRWGNVGAAGEGVLCRGRELGEVLVDVAVGERAAGYAARAKELAVLCERSGGGRVIAARSILEEIGREEGGEEKEEEEEDEDE